MTDIQDIYRQCLQSFAEGSFQSCAKTGLFLTDFVYNVDLYHVLLNSLKRLDRSAEADALYPTFSNILKQLPWEHKLLELSMGKAELTDVLPEAEDELQRCRAHYYAGSSLLTRKEPEGAAKALEDCLIIGGNAECQCVERQLAKSELQSIEGETGQTSAMLELRKCVDAFVRHDYTECARVAIPLVQQVVSPDLFHILLISLHRMGMMKQRDDFGTLFLRLFDSDPWIKGLLLLTLEQSSIADVLPSAGTPERQCQAHYYDGARLMTSGQVSAAWAQFEKCLSFDTECLERQLAEAELKTDG